MSMPRPGSPVRGSTTGRPIMALLDLLGRRWVLRVLWEIHEGPVGFRALQARCDGMSPSVLSQRLAELRGAGIVTQTESSEYLLSTTGETLYEALRPLNDWAFHWGERMRAEAARQPSPPIESR